ncbi:MAG: hypothetical protein GYB64_19025, partial [Chloroflexi bacterium]|nr:hypothetical protein [Chloroflexota bacterium]
MFKNKKWIVLVTGVLAAIILAACATPTPETIVVTEIVEGEEVEVVITATPDPEAGDDMDGDDMDDAEAGTPADQFVTGIFSEPVTTNYWNYLGPGSDVWTGYALSGRIPAVYGLGDQRYDFVPSLAAGLPGDRTEDGDFVTIEVELLEGLTWSDGEALTAEDVAFTLDTVDRLNLGGNWATYNPEKFDRVEAVDETTLVYYFNDVPGLAEFEFGIALAPVLPEHYWAPIVEEAAAALEEVGEAPEAPGENATEDEQAAYDEELAAFQDAQEEARSILYQADVADEPVFGPYGNVEYEPGAFAAKQALDNYYFTGSQTTLYANGAYQTILPDGTEQLFYGDASGDVALELETGPFVNEVIYSIYGSQDAAFLALQDGEIDYV